jgi:hypothetical protein
VIIRTLSRGIAFRFIIVIDVASTKKNNKKRKLESIYDYLGHFIIYNNSISKRIIKKIALKLASSFFLRKKN